MNQELITEQPEATSTFNYFSFNGEVGPLFGLFLKNVLFSILTLGFYRFWGKVEINKYLYSSISLVGRSFGYHATGKERCRAFLIALAIWGSVFGITSLIVSIVPDLSIPLTIVFGLAFVFFLQPFIIVGQWRYRLSRSSWSNVRFRCSGTYKEFLPIYTKGVLLSIITLGIYVPWFVINIQQYLINNSSIGQKEFTFQGKGSELFKIYLIGYLLTMVTFGIYTPWLMASIIRYFAENTRLDDHPFQSEITGVDVFLIYLFLICSFGIFLPIAVHYAFKVFFSKLNFFASEDYLTNIINISDENTSALADGFAEAADVADAMSGAF